MPTLEARNFPMTTAVILRGYVKTRFQNLNMFKDKTLLKKISDNPTVMMSFHAHETDNNAVHESKLCEVPNTMEQGKGIRGEGDICSLMWGQGRPSHRHREGMRAGDQ